MFLAVVFRHLLFSPLFAETSCANIFKMPSFGCIFILLPKTSKGMRRGGQFSAFLLGGQCLYRKPLAQGGESRNRNNGSDKKECLVDTFGGTQKKWWMDRNPTKLMEIKGCPPNATPAKNKGLLRDHGGS